MKIAVAAMAGSPESPPSEKFGKCPWLLFFDNRNERVKIVPNEPPEERAGVAMAKKVLLSGARLLVTGNIGPHAEESLRKAGIRIFLARRCRASESVKWIEEMEIKEPEQDE